MNNFIKRFKIIILLIILNSCNFQVEKVDQLVCLTITPDLSRAKELGVLLIEYQPKRVSLNDSIAFEIESAWLEYNYYYSDLNKENNQLVKEFEPMEFHLSLIINEDMKSKYKGFNKNWYFENMTIIEPEFPKESTSLISLANLNDSAYLNDSLKIKLNYSVPTNNPNEFDKTYNLGSFYIHKKKVK